MLGPIMDTAHCCQPDGSELPAATAPHPALPRGRASAGMSPALLSRTRDPTRTPSAMWYVSYHPRVASGCTGKAGGALASLGITTSQCTTAALAGGAHAWRGVRRRLLCTRDPTHTPNAMWHVPYRPRMASGRADKAGGSWLR